MNPKIENKNTTALKKDDNLSFNQSLNFSSNKKNNDIKSDDRTEGFNCISKIETNMFTKSKEPNSSFKLFENINTNTNNTKNENIINNPDNFNTKQADD